MAPMFKASTALFLSFNLLFFVLVTSSRYPSNGVGGLLNGILGGNSDDSSVDPSSSSNPVVVTPRDVRPDKCGTLDLGVCLNVLNGLLDVNVGEVPSQPCCSLIQGLLDIEVALCLCTDINLKVAGILNLDVPISLNLLLNDCRRGNSTQYICSP